MPPYGHNSDVERKRVLVIGMLDSVHFARWLKQFDDQNIDFYILSSKKFRKVNPLLVALSSETHSAKYKFLPFFSSPLMLGYLDFTLFVLSRKFFGFDLRSRYLSVLLKICRFDFVHALEIQGAGYLVSSVDPVLYKNSKVIITNWGSDIYFFKDIPDHRLQIKLTLSIADYYSAECVRDYDLARDLGFDGIDLPCIPNAGGFDLCEKFEGLPITSERTQVLIKGYGNTFGRAELVVKLIPHLVEKYPTFTFHFYSVTEDTLQLLNKLDTDLISRIKITTARNKLSHTEMILEFSKSRIYIGCSTSDGISTSFLEALLTGCYPIQTDTSCANEWLQKGAIASIIPLESDALLNAIEMAICEDENVNQAAKANRRVAENHLNYEVIKQQSLVFYS